MPTAPRALLSAAIDYAGLFPPASLAMSQAVKEYDQVHGSDDAWALGRFVVPAGRLQEFRDAGGGAWRLAAILGNELVKDLDQVARFNALDAGALADTVEFRVLTPEALREAIGRLPSGLARFAEWPLGADPAGFVTVVAGSGVAAKFRTGGIVEDAFPDPDRLLAHLAAVVAAGIPFKCTAGLHHPVRGRYRLTYDGASAQGMMYGYLNVMLAAAALQDGQDMATARAILLEEEAGTFELAGEQVRWRHVRFTADDLSRLRAGGFISWGSCSFREPFDELSQLAASH